MGWVERSLQVAKVEHQARRKALQGRGGVMSKHIGAAYRVECRSLSHHNRVAPKAHEAAAYWYPRSDCFDAARQGGTQLVTG